MKSEEMLGNKNIQAFMDLVEAGLWEKDIRLARYGKIDFKEVYRIAQYQAVVGLVAAGLEHVTDIQIPQNIKLSFAGSAIQLEELNKGMNSFIEHLINEMRAAGIHALLVKGQGIAQSYEKPLWRSCGDIDLFLNNDNYLKAKAFLNRYATEIHNENSQYKHQAFKISNWDVELHGTLRIGLWKKADNVIDDVQSIVFREDKIRTWNNGRTPVFLPHPDEDTIFVFTHILQHYFRDGVGLRQICDWCRLLWAYHQLINKDLLLSRLTHMGIITEWRAFAAFAVYYLGMPPHTIPYYSPNRKWKNKAAHILESILYTGDIGHNSNQASNKNNPLLVNKAFSLWRHTNDISRNFSLFPFDAIRIWWYMMTIGLKNTFLIK